jgi:HSP20 family molecular chaperone IbpA
MRLPATYNTEACTASFEHGVLRLVFPKSEAAKPRRIQIGANGQPAVASGKASS